MAYPILQTANTANGADNVSSTSRTITLPSGLVSGDLILIVYDSADAGGAATVNMTSNTGVYTRPLSGTVSGTSNKYGVFFKWSNGTESSLTETITHSTGANITNSVFSAYRISGANSSKTPVFQFLNASLNPPSITTGWGGGENLFIALASHVQGGSPTLSTYPTGYTNGTNFVNSAAGIIAQASLQSTNATEDPPTFTFNYTNARSFVISVAVGASSPPSVTSINSGSPIRVGQRFTVNLSNFSSTPTSVTCTYASGTKNLTVGSITGNASAIDVTLEDRSEGIDYPTMGSTLDFSFTDGVGTAISSSTITGKVGEVAQTLSLVITQYSEYFAYHFLQDGFTSEGAEFTYIPYGDFTLRADSGFSATGGGVVTGWLRPVSGFGVGNVYYYEFTISESGAVVLAEVKFYMPLSIGIGFGI